MKTWFQRSLWGLAISMALGCSSSESPTQAIASSVSIDTASLRQHFDASHALIDQAHAGFMKGPGLVGVCGGTHLKAHSSGPHEILLSMVQLTESQIPLSLTLKASPPEALNECRLVRRDPSNTALLLKLNATTQDEIEVEWASTLLIIPAPEFPANAEFTSYMDPSPCVQSDSPEIIHLAKELRANDAPLRTFAGSIQTSIREMKQTVHPKSLDALGILQSGANWICTANANLAAALLRNQNIPSRTLAVIPVNSMKLEMHRITEFYENGRWVSFDPSSLQIDIPLKPWQNIVVSETTLQDEAVSMKPRMGTAMGSPYGHELEFMNRGLTFTGNDFYWTQAKPLAEFETTEENIKAARESWIRFIETGIPQPNWGHSIKAATQETLEKSLQEN